MDEGFAGYLREVFADFGEIRMRAMFGGQGLYHEGTIIGIVIDDALYLKVDALTQPAFEAAGCAPFVYELKRKALQMSYWSVPAEALDSPQAMLPWARRAFDAALRKQQKRPRRSRPG